MLSTTNCQLSTVNYLFLFFIPIKRTFFVYIKESKNEYAHKKQHIQKARPISIFKIYRPRIEKYHFHVEKDEQNGDKKIFD